MGVSSAIIDCRLADAKKNASVRRITALPSPATATGLSRYAIVDCVIVPVAIADTMSSAGKKPTSLVVSSFG
jgi:hypothetical protein